MEGSSIRVPVEIYNSIRDFILSTVKEHEVISLSMLLDEALQCEALSGKDNLGWYLLQVKRDMEAKGVITVDRKNILLMGQRIKLSRKSKSILKTQT